MPQYPEDVIDRLHLLWGDGFMSPGGGEEVRRIVHGIDLRGRSLLDIGCGTGGPAVVLARDLGARVTGLDVEPLVIDRARTRANAEGVSNRIDFVLAAPGPLPFDDACFDVVFSKDALIHVADKAALYGEILRVLKPGGKFLASDWLAGEEAGADPAFRAFLAGKEGEMDFRMATAAETARIMRAAGFDRVETEDRNSWYADYSARELEALEGPLRPVAIERMGQERYEAWMVTRRQITRVTATGSLRPTDLRGRRPE